MTAARPDIAMARSVELGRRLTPSWQDERELLADLSKPNLQWFLVMQSGLAERRRIGGMRPGVTVRWQLRLSLDGPPKDAPP